MPNQVHGVVLHAMSGTELSRVRTALERRRILTSIPSHPVQANPQLPAHRYLGNALVPTHRQVNVPTSPLADADLKKFDAVMVWKFDRFARSSTHLLNSLEKFRSLSVEIDGWAKDFLELLDGVKHLDLVFSEAQGMDISYIALCDWRDESRMLVLQTLPVNATKEQRQMALAITSVITALLYRFGHFDVGEALLAIGAQCKSTIGCSRIPEAASQFNFSSIPGHVSRSASPVVLN
jgi:hypothetical protein